MEQHLDTPYAAQAIPPTAKQITFARSIAGRQNILLPWDVQQDRRALSRWIDRATHDASASNDRPTSKQVAYAEKLSRIKRRPIPEECFQSRDLMSRWIDANGFRK